MGATELETVVDRGHAAASKSSSRCVENWNHAQVSAIEPFRFIVSFDKVSETGE